MSQVTPSELSASDDDLIRQTLAGDRDAFGHLVLRHQQTLLDLTLRMLGSREEAEDVIQHVFIEAYRHLSGFRHGSQFSTWLYAIALNRARNQLRSRKTRRHVSIDEVAPDDDTRRPMQLSDKAPRAEDVLERQFDLEWIQREVQLLSPEYQEIFTLHYFQDFPLLEIAKRLDRPIGTIKVYLHRARKDLYRRWEDQKKSRGT